MKATTQPQFNPQMMRVIVIITVIVLTLMLISCNPCKRLQRLCPTETHDSISYREIVKLDTLIITLPGDTSYIEVPIVSLEDLGILTDNSNQKVELKVKDGILKLRTICKEDSLQVVISELTKELSENKIEIQYVDKPVPVKFTPKWVKTLACIGGVCILLIILYILYKVFKPKIPFIR